MAAANRQKILQQFIARRHPEYEDLAPHWAFVVSTYQGGRAWFEDNLFKYHKEGDEEFKDRKERAYRFNHTRQVVDLVDKYIFKMEISRNEGDAPESVKAFWKEATLNRATITDLMKQASNRSSLCGRIWAVVDSNKPSDALTRAEERAAGARVYAYLVLPQNAVDMGYDEEGKLTWILLREFDRDDVDPIEATGELKERYRLWTRKSSQLFEVEREGRKVKVIERDPIEHGLGFVPVFAIDNVMSDEPYASPGMVDDVAYLDRAVANYLSNLDAIIQDQTFSQLMIPAQGLIEGDDDYKKLLEFGTKRIVTFNGERTNFAPFYLSPDPKQAELILKVINKIISEIYHSSGLAGERTKEDNSMGIDNSSGVAKAYDFERVNSLLAAKADALQAAENTFVRMAAAWHGDSAKIDALEKPLVEYPDNFDVRSLYDEFEIAARLALVEAPDGMRREQMDKVMVKLFPNLKRDLIEKMRAEMKSWPPKIDPLTGEKGGTGSIQQNGRNSLSNALVK